MRVLITGAMGYIGGRLVEYLRHRPGFALRLLVREVPADRADWLKGLEVWRGDLTRPETLRGIGDGIDAVVHLAALNEIQCEQDPVAALRVNVEGTLNLLQAIGPTPRSFLYLSTIHVYGANSHGVVTENTPLAPLRHYAATHAMAEHYVHMIAQNQKKGAAILRLSNSVGAPIHPAVNRWTLLANDLCRHAVTDGRLVLKSPGHDVRNFVAMADVVRATEFLLQQPLKDLRTFNVGSSTSHSVLAVAEMIQQACIKVLGRKPSIERPDPKPGQIVGTLDYRCDAISQLGFKSSASLQEAIKETLEFCQRNSQAIKNL